MTQFKKYLVASFLFLSIGAWAQEEDTPVNLDQINDKKHELRIDALEGLLIPAIDIAYEYVISRYSGVGASVYVSLSDDGDFDQDFSFTPYYRQYFFNKKDFGARGFFAEGLLQYGTGEGDVFNFDEDSGVSSIDQETWSLFGVGFAIGQKWVSRNGFVIELSVGGGRYFGAEDFAPEGFFRGGVNVGYRF